MRYSAFYSTKFNTTGVTADTVTKADHVAALVARLEQWRLVEPTSADLDELERVHDAEYLEAVLTGEPADLAASNGIGWDEMIFAAAASSTGGIRDAALEALRTGGPAGALSSGLHHARAESGEGYCTFNGLVVASRAALSAGARRVLILDLDAHCGGGTASLIDGLDGVEQVDVSTSAFDVYRSRADAQLVLSSPATYLADVEASLGLALAPEELDLILYNAGMDPHEHAGGRDGLTTEMLETREQMVFEWARHLGVPVAFALAGGYRTSALDLDGVAELHLLTFHAAAAG
jgi:acetoin utilization deacetylase AcuC-like enzyme